MNGIAATVGISGVLDVESRIRNRRILVADAFEKLRKTDPEDRRRYTIRKLVELQELWTVWDGDELPSYKSSGNDVVHIWPHKEFAESFSVRKIKKPRFVPIPVDEWIDRVLLGPCAPLDVSYFPVSASAKVVVDNTAAFIEAVSTEWARTYGPREGSSEEIYRGLKKNMIGSIKSGPVGKIP